MSKTFSAVDDDDGTTTWVYLQQATNTCAATPPGSGTSSYNEGDNVVLISKDDNEDYLCFWSRDALGNYGVKASGEINGIDRTGPTITITAPDEVAISTPHTVTFEIVDDSAIDTTALGGFTRADVTFTGNGGTLSPSLSGSGKTFTATFTAGDTVDTSVTISVPADLFQDVAGNKNMASAAKTIRVVAAPSSSQPAVALKDHTHTLLHTQSSTPTFVITNVAGGATVSVEASRNARTVSKSGTVGASPANSIEIPFTGSDCTIETIGNDGTKTTTANQSCSLAEGIWAVVVTHTDGSKPATTSQVTVAVDTTAPAIAIVNPGTSAATSKTFRAYDGDAEDVTTWMSRVQSESVCAATAPTGGSDPAESYTERGDLTLSSEDDNGKYVCFWSTDAAGNTAVRRSAAIAGIDANARALTITSEHSTLNIGAETTLRFISNEPISGFAADDIDLNPATGVATLSGFTAVSSTVYEATLRADAAGSVTVSVAANKYTLTADSSQNANASNNLAITILVASEAPGITAVPDVAAGDDTFTVSGTTNEADGTVLTVQVGTGQHSVFATVIAASGAWTTEPLSVANLSGSQIIMVTATAPGEGPSAPAQGTVNIAAKPVPANHTAITVLDADATRDSSPAALGVSYTLTPTPADCASAQSSNSGISASAGSVIHHLDHRCDWSVAFTHTAQCQVTVAVRNDATDVATNQTSPIALTKPADPSANSAFTFNSTAANTLAISVNSAIGNCTSELVIAAQDGTSNISSLNGQNITYTLTPSDCRTDGRSGQRPVNAEPHRRRCGHHHQLPAQPGLPLQLGRGLHCRRCSQPAASRCRRPTPRQPETPMTWWCTLTKTTPSR